MELKAITDIVFVSKLDQVPKGYTAIKWQGTHVHAQLWERTAEDKRTRYLCYTRFSKEVQCLVIEDIYIPEPEDKFVKEGYQIVARTTDGRESLKDNYLAIKKVPWSHAKRLVVDIQIYTAKTEQYIPNEFTKLRKFNNLYITFLSSPLNSALRPDELSEVLNTHTTSYDVSTTKTPLPNEAVPPQTKLTKPHQISSISGSSAIDPITNVVMVCSLDNVPEGYTVIEMSASKICDAQLWENREARRKQVRYLCYTKQVQKNGLVLEDMVISTSLEVGTKAGFKPLTCTVKGKEILNNKFLELKKVPRGQARQIIVDIDIYEDTNMIPRTYTRLRCVNNLHIAYHAVPCNQLSQVNPETSIPVTLPHAQSPQLPPPLPSAQMYSSLAQQEDRVLSSSESSQLPPITDIGLVCSPRNAPKGYHVIEYCCTARQAQLWENDTERKMKTRYLCYTRDKQEGDFVLEDISIVEAEEILPSEGYQMIFKTVEGEYSLKYDSLAVKKSPRAYAQNVITSISIYCQMHQRHIPKLHTKLKDINGLHIAFQTSPFHRKLSAAHEIKESIKSIEIESQQENETSYYTPPQVWSHQPPPQTAPHQAHTSAVYQDSSDQLISPDLHHGDQVSPLLSLHPTQTSPRVTQTSAIDQSHPSLLSKHSSDQFISTDIYDGNQEPPLLSSTRIHSSCVTQTLPHLPQSPIFSRDSQKAPSELSKSYQSDRKIIVPPLSELNESDAITDIVFVSSLDNVPQGYTVIETCVGDGSAQLYENDGASEGGTSYLCYAKNKQSKVVVEDMKILGFEEPPDILDYQILFSTVEGQDALTVQKCCLIKKVLRNKAKEIIMDIAIYREVDQNLIPESYTKLWSTNKLHIAFQKIPSKVEVQESVKKSIQPAPTSVEPHSSPAPPLVQPHSSPTPPSVQPHSIPTPPSVQPHSSPTHTSVAPHSSPTPPSMQPRSSPTPPSVQSHSLPAPTSVEPHSLPAPRSMLLHYLPENQLMTESTATSSSSSNDTVTDYKTASSQHKVFQEKRSQSMSASKKSISTQGAKVAVPLEVSPYLPQTPQQVPAPLDPLSLSLVTPSEAKEPSQSHKSSTRSSILSEPITDLVFVNSVENAPPGYTVIDTQGCGSSYAQLWENERVKEGGTRYLCYTKKRKSDVVVEDIKIHGTKDPHAKGYQRLTDTVEGGDPLKNHGFLLKKNRRSKAKEMVVDIVIYPDKDQNSIPKAYIKLKNVNNFHIAVRKMSSQSEASGSINSTSTSKLSKQSHDLATKKPSETLSSRPYIHDSSSKKALKKPFIAHEDGDVVPQTAVPKARSNSSQSLHSHPNCHEKRISILTQDHVLAYSECSMSHAITDIQVVCSLDNVPPGYTVLDNCTTDCHAQLWENEEVTEEVTRYICYKKDASADAVIEDIKINTLTDALMTGAYKYLTGTVEKEKPLKNHYLLIKKSPRNKAREIIVDIVIYQDVDQNSVPESYTKLKSVNNLLITVRKMPSHRGMRESTNTFVSQPSIKPNIPPQSKPMEAPITDILFVSSPQNVPEDYTILEDCTADCYAQLWENETVAEGVTRYICYKKDSRADVVIEDIKILELTDAIMAGGYQHFNETVEKEAPLKNHYCLIKKSPKNEAKEIIVDIVTYHVVDQNSVPESYTKLKSINNLLITLRKMPSHRVMRESTSTTISQPSIKPNIPPQSKPMQAPITDILFVSSLQNVPEGYTILDNSTAKCHAQLWENGTLHRSNTGHRSQLREDVKRKSVTRYLCYTRKIQNDDKVVVNAHLMPCGSSLPEKGALIQTLEGDVSLKHHIFSIKKEPRAQAKQAVLDIVVLQHKQYDGYTELGVINGLPISILLAPCPKLLGKDTQISADTPIPETIEGPVSIPTESLVTKPLQRVKYPTEYNDRKCKSVAPITNIILVSSPNSVPQGYVMIEKCGSGCSAQLREKADGEPGTYLCYTRAKQVDGKLVEDFTITSTKAEDQGFKLITETVEGHKALTNKWLGVRRVPKNEAKSVLCDIMIFHCSDEQNIPDFYTKTESVNQRIITCQKETK